MVYAIINNKKGIGGYFWYILFFAIIAITLFGFKFIGGTLLGELQQGVELRNSLTHKLVVSSLSTKDSLTGRTVSKSIPLTSTTLSALFSSERDIAIRVVKNNNIFYSDEELFIRMNERVPIVNEKRITILDDGTSIEVLQSLS